MAAAGDVEDGEAAGVVEAMVEAGEMEAGAAAGDEAVTAGGDMVVAEKKEFYYA
jgi:hypothetical protein